MFRSFVLVVYCCEPVGGSRRLWEGEVGFGSGLEVGFSVALAWLGLARMEPPHKGLLNLLYQVRVVGLLTSSFRVVSGAACCARQARPLASLIIAVCLFLFLCVWSWGLK